MHSARFAFLTSFTAGLALAGAACNSHPDNVCQNIGDCSYGGSDDFITACQDEAKALRSEASGNGCGPAFDAYYACADSSYSCQGATAVFPGCDGDLAALDSCLAAATIEHVVRGAHRRAGRLRRRSGGSPTPAPVRRPRAPPRAIARPGAFSTRSPTCARRASTRSRRSRPAR